MLVNPTQRAAMVLGGTSHHTLYHRLLRSAALPSRLHFFLFAINGDRKCRHRLLPSGSVLTFLRCRCTAVKNAQVLSVTDIETDDQALAAGDSDAPIDSDTSLMAALRRTGGGVYGNYPVIRVTKRAADTGGAGNGGISAAETEAKGKQATTDTPEWEGCCSKT